MPDAVDLRGLRRLPVVHDERFDHYPEFGAALLREWGVEGSVQFARRFYRAGDGLYEVRVWGNERGFPAEADLACWIPEYAAIDGEQIDAGVWAFLGWLLRQAGGDWAALDPDRLARRFGIPVPA